MKRTKEIMKFHTQWPPGQAQHRRRHGARSRSAFRGQAMFQKEETPGGSSPRSWPANYQRRSHRTCFRALELGDRARASVAENSHQLTRQRERLMRRFKSAEHAQRFLGPFGAVGDHFRVGRNVTAAATRRQLLGERHSTGKEVVGIRVAS